MCSSRPAGCRRAACACRPCARSARRPSRPRRARARDRGRSRSAWAGRTRSTGPSGPWRGSCGTARWRRARSNDRSTCASSRACRARAGGGRTLAHRVRGLRPLTSLKLRVQDLRERDPLVPPRRLQFIGEGDFAATGDEFLRHLVELAGMAPDSRVLDVGSGIGRIARPLTRFLDERGSYEGFDVNPVGVGWCQTRYPERFGFTLADLFNARYQPHGRHRAAEYRFPYDDDAFDVAIASSVLTHLLEDEAAHYLSEIARVLKPGGRALVTFFLLDDESRAAIRDRRAALGFLSPEAHVAVLRDDLPEEAVAYDEAWVREHARVTAVHHGGWRGRPGRSFQDLVVACA